MKPYHKLKKCQSPSEDEYEEEDSLSLCNDIPLLHTLKDEVTSTFNNTLNDKFLSKLVVTDESKEKNNDSQNMSLFGNTRKPYFLIYDPTQHWKLQKKKTMMCMHFKSPKKLKVMLQNYVVANGYNKQDK